ncbi:PEP-CTERM sorting domain-containing protein [Nitrosospira sp. Nsp11]
MRLGWGCSCPKSEDCDQLLTAVPEPETYATLLTGLGLLGFMSHAARVFV